MASILKQPSVYGVVELNNVASVRTGEVKTQLALNATDFATAVAQNGMLLMVDEFAGEIKLPTAITDYVYLHASVEKDYQDLGRKHFAVKTGEFLPRVYKLHVGDTFETNAFQWSDATYATFAALKADITSAKVYGIPSTTGLIEIVTTAGGTEVVVLKALKTVTLPNGETGIKFAVVKA